eukprot:XP_014049598.1 PREDICTED: centrosomal protein of 112 kDa-like [Salmo salar]
MNSWQGIRGSGVPAGPLTGCCCHRGVEPGTVPRTNTSLKQIEKEFSQKLAKSAQLIAELQTSVCDAKEEGLRQQQEKERQLKEATARWDDERRQMSRHTDTKNKDEVKEAFRPAFLIELL